MDQLLRSDADGVATLTLNRPERRNALTTDLLEALVTELDGIAASPQVRAVLLTGAGGTFCAGADVAEYADRPDDPGRRRRVDLVGAAIARLRALEQPTVAAVAGYALGAGWGLALACDLTYAASDATFSLPEVARGFMLPTAITTRLVEVVGPVRAAEITLGGARWGAADGVGGGWVARELADADAVHEHAAAFCRALADRPASANAQVLHVLRDGRRGGATRPTESPMERGEK